MTDTALTSFSFAKLVVKDLDASRRFYETVAGVSNPQEISSKLAGRPLRELIYNDAAGRPLLILSIASGSRRLTISAASDRNWRMKLMSSRVREHGGALKIKSPPDFPEAGVAQRTAEPCLLFGVE